MGECSLQVCGVEVSNQDKVYYQYRQYTAVADNTLDSVTMVWSLRWNSYSKNVMTAVIPLPCTD